ncbi:MAG: glutathione S-transferase [Rubrivivax sp.]|nr:MAG: glutathione S-transferase [Rubrivivax sp.]
MTLPILYSFRRCPYAIRARLALKLAGVTVELREVVLRHKPAELLALSPKATVPVMRLPDGLVLEQSLDIMRWALARQDPEGRPGIGDTAEGQALIEANDGRFKALLDRYKYPERYPDQPRTAYRDEAMAWLLTLDHRLIGTPQLLGDQPALADLALLPFVRQFALVDADWFEHQAPCPRLKAWLHAWTHSAVFETVMVKLAPWQAGTRGLPW